VGTSRTHDADQVPAPECDTRLARGLGWGQAEDFFVSLRDNFRENI
jgi:hypothetical protein